MHHYIDDMKHCLFILLMILFIFGCSRNENKDSLTENDKKSVIESYLLAFNPSFHNNLILRLDIVSKDTIKFYIIQNRRIIVYDSTIHIAERIHAFESFGDSSAAVSLVKPNFIIEYYLSKTESFDLIENLHDIEKNCIKSKEYEIGGEDGMTIHFKYKKGETLKSGKFWSPSKYSPVGKACFKILEFLEQNPSDIIEKSAEKIKLYISESESKFKVVSKNPLYIKVYDTPCCPCQPDIREFLKTLPDANEIFLDITNYGFYKREEEDVSCLEKEFRKKYKHVRWILETDDYERFENLIYKEK